MRTAWFLTVITLVLVSPAHSGRNAHGRLVVHTPESTLYTQCYQAADCCDRQLPQSCEELNARVPALDWITVIWFLAYFRPSQAPAVTAIQFGVDHDLREEFILQWQACGPVALELPDADWPQGGGDGRSGSLIALTEPVTENIWPFYWFAVTSDRAGSYFMTSTYPSTGEAMFADDGNPPVEDEVEGFGRVEWLDYGCNECDFGETAGACCFPDSSCMICMPGVCEAYGGIYMGDEVPCYPNPCQIAYGACCFGNGSCEVLAEVLCPEMGGFFQGADTTCDPDPCGPKLGACCLFPEDTCGYILDQRCLELHGTFVGYGIPCDPNPCGLEYGACCLPDQSCQEIFRYGCVALGGQFQGVETDCNPNPCIPSPTRVVTWGEIRSSYR